MNDRPKKNRPQIHPADNYSCPVCGGKHFTWGQPSAMGGWLGFKTPAPKASQFGKPMMARACERCGNVLFFVDPAQLDDGQ